MKRTTVTIIIEIIIIITIKCMLLSGKMLHISSNRIFWTSNSVMGHQLVGQLTGSWQLTSLSETPSLIQRQWHTGRGCNWKPHGLPFPSSVVGLWVVGCWLSFTSASASPSAVGWYIRFVLNLSCCRNSLGHVHCLFQFLVGVAR